MTVYLALDEAQDESTCVLGIRRTFAEAVALCCPRKGSRPVVESPDGATLVKRQGPHRSWSVYREELPE